MKEKSILKRLELFMGEKKYLFSLSLVFSAISSVLSLLPFVFIWFIIREILLNPQKIDMAYVKFYAFATILSALVALVVYFLTLTSSHLAAFRAEVGMRKFALKKISNMPLGYFTKHPSGKIRNIIDEGASATHTFLAHQMPDFAATVVTPITLLVLVFAINWKLGLVSLIPMILGFIASSFMMSKQGEEARKAYMEQLEKMSSEAVEYVRGIPVVKTFGGSVYAFKRFVDSILSYKELVIGMTLFWQKPMSFYTAIVQSTAFFLVPFALLYISEENLALALSDFIFYILIAPNFTLIFMRSMYFQNNVSIAKHTMDRFEGVLKYENMDFKNEDKKLHGFDISFENVCFSYEKEGKNVLDNISFKVPQGKCIALVGKSGGGKTTIARLIARFWDVQKGEIKIGGVNIKDIPKDTLMRNISFVFQNTKLFKTSIKENITLSKNVSKEELNEAVRLSQSKEIIDNLKDGLDTVIGSKGVYLSGGEQQRIALARAILKDAPIVLLDEATAFADPENEHLIQKALKELRNGKTTIMIAHRLTSVTDVHQILVIDEGKIIQSGTHEELLSEDGAYKEMWDEYAKSIQWKIKDVK